MKTPITMLIEQMEKHQSKSNGGFDIVGRTTKVWVNLAKSLLDEEKRQIDLARLEGFKDGQKLIKSKRK